MTTTVENEAQIERLLTAKDLARHLNVSTRTIQRWAKDGSFPRPLRIGARYVRWRLRDVQDWLDTDCIPQS